ncbi:MAG: UDP-3-O-acyl-N-acetylglucosamine deacetylase [Pseudomonadota bacterium]
MRRTLKSDADFAGVGLHGGLPVRMTVSSAPSGAGIAFLRVDVPIDQQTIPARYDLVTDTLLCTKLTNEHGVSVGTVEHIMAALAGCGINDAMIALDGPEVPIMDGSSAEFVEGLMKVGIVHQHGTLDAIRILRPVVVEDGDKRAALMPADQMEMDFRIAFDDAAIGHQEHSVTLMNGAFVSELSDCRTFGHLKEVEQLRSMGLARGGGLHNAIVVDSGRVLNPEGLRRPDEFVRHKMLDAVGDLALAGAPILGRYEGEKAGHGMTNQLLRALFDQPDAWEWDILSDDLMLGGGSLTAGHSAGVTALAI